MKNILRNIRLSLNPIVLVVLACFVTLFFGLVSIGLISLATAKYLSVVAFLGLLTNAISHGICERNNIRHLGPVIWILLFVVIGFGLEQIGIFR